MRIELANDYGILPQEESRSGMLSPSRQIEGSRPSIQYIDVFYLFYHAHSITRDYNVK